MSVNAHLDCDYSLGPTSKGCRVPGGWNWPGWGYGQCQLFPPEDATVRHVDLEEEEKQISCHQNSTGLSEPIRYVKI